MLYQPLAFTLKRIIDMSDKVKTDIIPRSDGKVNVYRYMVDPTVDVEDFESANIPVPKRWVLVDVKDTIEEAKELVKTFQ